MKMRRALIGLLLVSGVTTQMIDDAWPQERQKFRFVSKPGTSASKFTQSHVIDVGDVPGHQLRIFEFQTMYTGEAPAIDGVKVKERLLRGVSDLTEGSGTANAYGITVLENGDKIFSRDAMQSHTTLAPDGSRMLSSRTVSTLTGGTGRFKGIRGTLLSSSETDLRTGLTDRVTEGEYWIEK